MITSRSRHVAFKPLPLNLRVCDQPTRAGPGSPTPPEPDDALLSINKAAEILRSAIDTLRYWRQLGIGHAASRSAGASSTGAARSTAGYANRTPRTPESTSTD